MQPADTLILMHRNPDGDAIGSAFALREALQAFGSRAYCICESEIPKRLRFLSDPFQQHVTVGSVPFDIANARVIAVDVASPSQLGGLAEPFAHRTDLMIDHHASGTPFAARCYVDGSAAAAGEIVFDLIRNWEAGGLIPRNPDTNRLLYAAISSDTGCFRFSNVTAGTHTRAAELVDSGIDCAAINHLLFESKSMEQLRAEAMGIGKLRVFHGGRVAVIAVSEAERQEAGLAESDLETLIDVARSLAGTEVAVTIRQQSEAPKYRVSLRSSGSYDVAALCAEFGGGGHVKAAGCTIFAPSPEAAVELIVSSIRFSDEI